LGDAAWREGRKGEERREGKEGGIGEGQVGMDREDRIAWVEEKKEEKGGN